MIVLVWPAQHFQQLRVILRGRPSTLSTLCFFWCGQRDIFMVGVGLRPLFLSVVWLLWCFWLCVERYAYLTRCALLSYAWVPFCLRHLFTYAQGLKASWSFSILSYIDYWTEPLSDIGRTRGKKRPAQHFQQLRIISLGSRPRGAVGIAALLCRWQTAGGGSIPRWSASKTQDRRPAERQRARTKKIRIISLGRCSTWSTLWSKSGVRL